MLNVTTSPAAFEFEVKNGGKVSFTVGDTTGKGKWSVEDDQFTLSIEGEEMVGTIGEDIISFDDMLEMGVKVIFCKGWNGCYGSGTLFDRGGECSRR